LAASKSKTPQDDDAADEVWVRATNGETAIRLRRLSHYLDKGGSLIDVRLLEDAEGTFTLWVRLADRPGEFLVNQFQYDKPRAYSDLNRAMSNIRNELGYFGPVTLQTDRRPSK